jgi:hypothetical protein
MIKGVNFALKPGESLAVIGPSAAGKTTLIRLLIGTLPASAGTSGSTAPTCTSGCARTSGRHVGYLPQDVELFDGTVFANIARMGEAAPEEVFEAAQLAGCHEMILRLPNGYETEIGDRRPVPVGRPAPAHRPGPRHVRPAEVRGAGRAEQQPRRRLRGAPAPRPGALEGERHHRGAGVAPADPGAGRGQGAAAEGRRHGDVRPARRGPEAPDVPGRPAEVPAAGRRRGWKDREPPR